MSKSTVTTSFEGLRLIIKSTADYILPAVFLSSAVVVIVIGLATIFITLFTSHKIAGPLYRIEKDVYEVTGGNLRKEFNLRTGDEVQAIADSLTAMTHTLRDEVDELKKAIVDLEGSLGGNASPQVMEKIKAIKARLDKFRT
jgi:methyl-accepting chemotaxis protein